VRLHAVERAVEIEVRNAVVVGVGLAFPGVVQRLLPVAVELVGVVQPDRIECAQQDFHGGEHDREAEQRQEEHDGKAPEHALGW
jgi:hypothetical protein